MTSALPRRGLDSLQDDPDGCPDPGEALASPTAQDSLDLVRRAQDGEIDALNQLFSRYYSRVRKIVRFRLGPALRGHLESDDILQETLIAAIHGFDRFEMRNQSSLLNWLARIAENQIRGALDYHSAKKRDKGREVALQRARDTLTSKDFVRDPMAREPEPLEGLVQHEDIEAVEASLDELSEDHREAILLRNYIGGTWAEIRDWTGARSADAARLRHARALTELSKLVRRRVRE